MDKTSVVGLNSFKRFWNQVVKYKFIVMFLATLVAYLLMMLIVFVRSEAFGSEAIYSTLSQMFYKSPDPKDAYMMQTDAFLKGQLYLDIIPSPELLALENPYTQEARYGIEYTWDFAFYNGRYYSYFGVVPVVICLLPIRLLTGHFISTFYFAFFLGCGVIVTLAILYNEIIKKYFSNISLLAYVFGLAALLLGSNILFLCARSWFYEIPYNSGLICVFLSFIFMLKASDDKRKQIVYSVLAGLFIALSVGCRPIYLMAVLIHIPLWLKMFIKERKQKKFYIRLSCYVFPIMVVGILLAVYNYLRFDSFTQFGSIYQLTVSDISKNKVFDMPKQREGLLRYLFQPANSDLVFPYVHLIGKGYTDAAYDMYSLPVVGIFRYPVMWGLLFYPYLIYKKNRLSRQGVETDHWFTAIIGSFLLCGIIILISVIGNAGIMERYTIDFNWAFFAASIFTMIDLVNTVNLADNQGNNKSTLKFVASLACILAVVVTAMIIIPIGMQGEFSRMFSR